MSNKPISKESRVQKRSSGFTIIEVLIVLAIAGLILLIVFLAVPALQRNARNTAIKNDVQNVVGGAGEFQGANNGTLPQSITGTGTITYKLTTGGNPTTISIQGSTVVTTSGTAPAAAPALGSIVVVLGKKCNSTTATPRAVSAYYAVETAGGSAKQCTES